MIFIIQIFMNLNKFFNSEKDGVNKTLSWLLVLDLNEFNLNICGYLINNVISSYLYFVLVDPYDVVIQKVLNEETWNF